MESKTREFSSTYTTDQIIKDCKEYSLFSWSAQASVNPMAIERAKGIYFWDTEGKKYIDLTSQLVLANAGHSHPHIIKSMEKQLRKLAFVSPAHATEIRAKVSKKIAEVTPGKLSKTFFTLGGADANENAIKMAQLYTGKKKILTRYRSYHGGTFVAANAGGDPRKDGIADHIPWMVKFHCTETMRSPLYKNVSQDEGDQIAFDLLAETVKFENPNTIAAIILEGYSGSSGVHSPGKKFWKNVRKLCTENNILLIVDEVMSGFGRTGEWFGVNHFDVVPDLMVMAKGLTSGYAPLGAVITTKKIAKHFDKNTLLCGLTYSAHALSLAACLATLEVYEKEDLISKAKVNGAYLGMKLKQLKAKYPIIGDVRGTGMHWCLDLVQKDGVTPLSPWNKPVNNKMKSIVSKLKAKGLVGLSRWNWIFINPPLVIKKKEIDIIIEVLDEVFSEVKQ